jgi:hypothetical protein
MKRRTEKAQMYLELAALFATIAGLALWGHC